MVDASGALPAIDGPALSVEPGHLREDTRIAKSLGLSGKLCLSADHAPLINDVMSPNILEVEWSSDFLADPDSHRAIPRDGRRAT